MKYPRLSVLLLTMLTLCSCSPAVSQTTTVATDLRSSHLGGLEQATQIPDGQQSSEQTAADPDDARAATALPQMPPLRAAQGTLNLLMDEETALPQALIEDFTSATGVHVALTVLNGEQGQASVDAFIGFDDVTLQQTIGAAALATTPLADVQPTQPGRIPAAVDYARDDICVLADRQWYEANRLQTPPNLGALAEGDTPGRLVLAPSASSSARVFAKDIAGKLGSNSTTWLGQISAAALTPSTWQEAAEASTARLTDQPLTRQLPGRPAWAGATPAVSASISEATGTKPLRVAPLSLAARTTPNTQAGRYFQPIDASCIPRTLYIAEAANGANHDATEAFATYLTSERAQKILAQTGAALPLNPEHAQDTVAEGLVK